MIACLPMYDWPEVQPAMDRFWALIRDALRAEGHAAPDTLTRDQDLWQIWRDPALLLGQTCGLPFRSQLHPQLSLVGTLDYGLPDAPAGYYYSVFVTRAGASKTLADYQHQCLAYNSDDSQSGWAAPQNHAADLGFQFTNTIATGAHRASVLAVLGGRADIAAIDAVSWRLVQAYKPQVTAGLQVIATTAPTPGLPLITAQPSPTLTNSVATAVTALSKADRATLGIKGLAQIAPEAYLRVPNPPSPDILAGPAAQNA